MDKGITAKKERKNEEEFTKKSLLKQKEKLTRDIYLLSKKLLSMKKMNHKNQIKNLKEQQ